MKRKARVVIDIEVVDHDPYSTEINELSIEGDSTTISIALMSAGFGMYDIEGDINKQMVEKMNFQKGMSMALLNGTISLNPNMPEEALDALSIFLTKLTDVNVQLLKEETEKNFNNPKKDKEDEQKRTGQSDFSNFS